MGATAAALVDLSTVAGNKISNPPWVKFQSAGWVNFPSAPTAEAQKLVRRCKEAVDAGKKVLVSFKIGDIWTDPFIYQNGDKKGQPGAQLKGRLLFIGRISVDGEEVYRAPERNASSDEADQSDGDGAETSSEAASPLSSVA
ncbi:MAG: DUF3577 domain-containing protein [Pseudomonadota bacterium]